METSEAGLFSGDARCSYHELLSKVLGPATDHLKSNRRIDWKSVEADLGVVLPSSFKLTSDILPAGFLGSGITWRSPDAKRAEFRFNRRALEDHANLIGDSAQFPLYPVSVPGYLVFATTSLRIDLAFWVEKLDTGDTHCRPSISLVECISGEVEDTGIEIDEFLYRAITNNIHLEGWLSELSNGWFFADKSFPLFCSAADDTPCSQQAL